jgi:hypothetical protein
MVSQIVCLPRGDTRDLEPIWDDPTLSCMMGRLPPKTIKQQRDGCTVGMRLTTSRSNSFKGETAARAKT